MQIQPNGPLTVLPNRLTLSRSSPSADVTVSGSRIGQYSLHYTLSGPEADSFDPPEDSRIFVGPKRRTPGDVNAYFRSVRNEIGFLNESCCMSTFTYPECPMTTDAVSFLSTCSWTESNNAYETYGIVFARFRMLAIPLSISGIEIDYNMGMISTRLSEASSCEACDANMNNVVNPSQLRIPERSRNCYYYPIRPEDTVDLLSSYALANTFIHRVSPLLPSRLGVSLLEPTSGKTPSFNDGDFSTALVEMEEVSNIEGCDHIHPDSPGLYAILRYAGSYNIQLRVYDEVQSHSTSGELVCLAVNLCMGMDSPVYIQLPRMLQTAISELNLLKPYKDADWAYSLDTATFYPTKKPVEISGTYWNGTSTYTPQFSGANLEIGSRVSPSLSSSKDSVRIKADPLGELGTLSVNMENSEVNDLYTTLHILEKCYMCIIVSCRIAMESLQVACLWNLTSILEGIFIPLL